MSEIKLIIAGQRTITNIGYIKDALMFYHIQPDDIDIIITGGAKGVDTIADQWAKAMRIDRVTFHANWPKYGKPAGPIRNRRMAEYGDTLLAILDTKTKSKGTKDMIEAAEVNGLIVYIYDINEG